MATQTAAIQTAQAPVGTLRQAATQFLLWAHQQGALATDAYFPTNAVGLPSFAPLGTDVAASSVLRQRLVRFVGINELQSTICVFLHRAAPTVKQMKMLPTTCNGYGLRYFQGNPNPISPAALAQSATTCAIHNAAGARRVYTCGSSISIGNDRCAGTVGCLVRDAAGVLYGLSNNHVSGCCNYAPVGLPVLAPGVIDVSPSNPWPFTLGLHSRQLQMLMGDPTSVNTIDNSDAAIFQLVPDAPISSMQRNYYDTPSSTLDLATGMTVEKVGRSSDRTTGIVHSEVIGAFPIRYAAPQYEFSGTVYFEPLFEAHGITDRFSEGGDSGSLVTHVDSQGNRHAVGIVVAGADDNGAPGGKRSFILPIRSILDRLQVTLVANHNV